MCALFPSLYLPKTTLTNEWSRWINSGSFFILSIIYIYIAVCILCLTLYVYFVIFKQSLPILKGGKCLDSNY